MNWRSWRNRYHLSPFADTQGHRSVLHVRNGTEQEGLLHETGRIGGVSMSTQILQSASYPERAQISGGYCESQRFGSLLTTHVYFYFNLYLVTNRVNARD